MIILDFETTGLLESEISPIDTQPYIIEVGAIKLNDKTKKEVGRLDFLVKPPVALPKVITKITGIRESDLRGQQNLNPRIPELVDFFMGEKYLLAHNLSFDSNVLRYELQRRGKLIKFPWPPNHICTIEETQHLTGKRLKMIELYHYLFKTELKQTHRAIKDVEALTRIVKELIKKGLIEIKG